MHIQVNDGTLIFVRQFAPVKKKIGHIHIMHGMSEHSGRYIAFAESLVAEGYSVSMHDHRGHGKTAELNNAPFGFFAARNGFETVVDDVEQVIQALGVTEPFILFGHSMGSFVARRYAQRYPHRLTHLILCGTGVATPLHHTGRYAARVLARWRGDEAKSAFLNGMSFKSFNKKFRPTRSDFDWLAQSNEAVDRYIDDPYCGFVSTTRFFADVSDGIVTISKKNELAKTPDIPILLISGSADPLGQMGKGIYKLARQLQAVGVENIQVYLAENMRHEILNERNRAHTIAQIKRWLYEQTN